MYHNAVRGGPIHGRSQHAKNGEVRTRALGLFVLCERTDRQTDAETDKQIYSTHHNILQPYRGEVINIVLLNTIKITNQSIDRIA